MSDFDGFDASFEDVMKIAERLLGGQGAYWEAPATAEPETIDRADRDELIDRPESFEYVLDAPGYEESQLVVTVGEREIQVAAPDFVQRRAFPMAADPRTSVQSYRNGILSVRVKKK